MISRKQFLDRGILATLCVGAFGALIPQLHSDDYLSDFDQKQSERLSSIQKSLKEEQSSKDIAQAKSKEVSAQLKDYGQFGPNQRNAAKQLAFSKIQKEILSDLEKAATSGLEGDSLTDVDSSVLEKNYGITLSCDSSRKQCEFKYAGSSKTEMESNAQKFKKKLKDNFKSEVWDSLGDRSKVVVAEQVLDNLSGSIKDIPFQEGVVSNELKAKIKTKVQSLGDKDSGEILMLEKELIEAETKDGSHKRLLLAEQKTYESLEKSESAKSMDDVCREFAQNVTNKIDLNRRLSSFDGKNDPCSSAFKEVVSKDPSKDSGKDNNSRGLAAGSKSSEGAGSTLDPRKAQSVDNTGKHSPIASGDKEKDDNGDEGYDSEPNNPNKSLAGGKIKKQKAYLSPAEQKKLKETHPEISEKIKALENERNQLMGSLDMRSKQDLVNACNQAAANLKKSIGLGSDNEKNERIVSGITDKLEKTLAKGYQGLVCDKSGANDGIATNASMEEASKDVLKGLGIPATGALTQSKQNTLESLSKGAMEVAANFANQRRNRMKLDFQMLEAASKKALSRIATENPNLLDANTLSYLRTLSYNELMGSSMPNGEVDVMTGAPKLGLLSNVLPPYALQTYQNYFDIALMDIKQKNGMGEEFDKQAECALAFAQTATQRWAEEEDRKGLLSLRVRGSSGLPVSNGTTVRNEESTRKVERNR